MGRKAIVKKRRLNTGVRYRLLESARPLLCTGIASEQKIEKIIHHMGISKSTFYEHFQSKEDLVMSVTQDLLERINSSIAILDKDGLPLVERLIRHLTRIATELSGISHCMFDNLRVQYPEMGTEIDQTFTTWENSLRNFIAAGINQEVFEKFSPTVMARLIISSLKNTCMSVSSQRSEEPKLFQIQDLIKISVKALIRPEKISFDTMLPLIEKKFSQMQWEYHENESLPVNCARSLGMPCPSGICG